MHYLSEFSLVQIIFSAIAVKLYNKEKNKANLTYIYYTTYIYAKVFLYQEVALRIMKTRTDEPLVFLNVTISY